MQDLLPAKCKRVPMTAKPKQLIVFFSRDLALAAKIVKPLIWLVNKLICMETRIIMQPDQKKFATNFSILESSYFKPQKNIICSDTNKSVSKISNR